MGHAPYGHAGERQINRFLKGLESFTRKIEDRLGEDITEDKIKKHISKDLIGDFRHNYQSIRILTFWEDYHPKYEDDGLNLTIPCLEGILKHTSIKPLLNKEAQFNFPGIKGGIFDELDLKREYSVTVEGQIVCIADEIAQITHDINDALRVNALSLDQLCKIKSIASVLEKDKMRYPNSINKCKNKENKRRAQITAVLLNHFIDYVIDKFKIELDKIRTILPKHSSDSSPFKLKQWILNPNDIDDKAFQDLRKLREDLVLNNYMVNRMDSKGEYIIRNLFEAYLNNPRQLYIAS